jgi:hypothetical protein
VVAVAAFATLRPKPAASSGSEVLIPALTLTSLPIGQLAAVNFIVDTPSVLNGTYSTEFATAFYILTPDEYSTYLLHAVLTGYEWTYATEGYVDEALFEISVPAGQWVFMMENTNATQASDVGWITALTVSPS